jgi:stage V sporulation protein D (sporulation-specific penicillin-binding protein)
MKKKISKKMKRNLFILFFIFTMTNITLVGRLIYIKHSDGELYQRRVYAQQTSYNRIIPYKRGNILDRNGNVLATSLKVYNLILDPEVLSVSTKQVKESTLEALNTYFNYSANEIQPYVDEPKGRHYVPLQKQLSYDEVKEFMEAMETDKQIRGVWLEEEFLRNYPYNDTAAHVLGFVSGDNEGRWGIEEYYNKELNGEIGREFGVLSDGLYVRRELRNPQNGYNIITTLDQTIQYYADKALKDFNSKYNSKGATAIVMNPKSGEVLALANSPTFNLNEPMDLSHLLTEEEIAELNSDERVNLLNSIWRNYAISDTYEPGSTFKPMTIVAAVEEGYLKGDETFECNGFKVVSGIPIRCWKEGGHGVQTISEALANSCNVALMDIAELMGSQWLVEYQRQFGFGQRTNISLPGEASAASLLYSAESMGPVELATNSFGQSFNVTPLQLITAFSSILNGGELLEPRIVKQITDEKGSLIESFEKKVVRKVMSKETAETISTYLFDVVLEGTGQKASIAGYQIGGKTGTAEKLPRGNGKYVVSFIGFTPIEDPEIIILVVVDEPEAVKVDSRFASEIFRDILTNILPYLNIYPTNS